MIPFIGAIDDITGEQALSNLLKVSDVMRGKVRREKRGEEEEREERRREGGGRRRDVSKKDFLIQRKIS